MEARLRKWLVSAGRPLRGLQRLTQVDFVVYNGADSPDGSGLRFDLIGDWVAVGQPIETMRNA